MFTGIIASIGRIESSRGVSDGLRVAICHDLPGGPVTHGESVAVSGCCLTALAVEAGRFEADLSPETISRTGGADAWAAGVHKNLERSLALGDKMGGHVVQGHVDRRVAILGHEHDAAGGSTLRVELPAADAAYLVAKGSVAIDGVSLTVALLRDSAYDIALIPETLRATTLGRLGRGSTVNVEYDVLGKYVLRALECRAREETTESAE